MLIFLKVISYRYHMLYKVAITSKLYVKHNKIWSSMDIIELFLDKRIKISTDSIKW